MKKFLTPVSLFASSFLFAQLPVTVSQPVIYAPAETVYLAPNGSDANTGAINSPLKTFYVAMQHLSWGVVNVNGGNAYGEVALLPGDYYPTGNSGFSQLTADWRQGSNPNYVYKNISIRGIGNVHIHGDSLNASNQMIFLMGSHVKVSNLYISNAPLHGVYMNGSPITHHSDVLIDSVSVDTCFGFGIYASGYDRVMATHCYVNESCRQNANEINGSCLWPSGLRTDDCWYVTFRNNIVCHSWGEGINTSYARYADVSDNVAYDNYSTNIYCHSSSKAMYHHNLAYNSDSAFWRYCYNSNGSSAYGISVANELSCTSGCVFSNSCSSNQSCCSFTDYDHAFNTAVNYYQVDSVFIYDNILLECGINVWDAFSSWGNFAYIDHLFIDQNTIIGREGSAIVVKAPLILNLGTPFIYFANMKVRNNIMSIDNTMPNHSDFYSYVPSGICNGTWTNNISFNGNLWHILPTTPGVSFSADQVSAGLPLHAVVADTFNLTPSASHPALIMSDAPISYITDDFYHRPRLLNTNAGALEYDVANGVGTSSEGMDQPFLYPNPAKDEFTIGMPGGKTNWNYEVVSVIGNEIVASGISAAGSLKIDASGWANGSYFVIVSDKESRSAMKLVVCR